MTPETYIAIIQGVALIVKIVQEWVASASGKDIAEVRADMEKEMGDTRNAQETAEKREEGVIRGNS